MFEKLFQRADYKSEHDGTGDWYLFHEGAQNGVCVVVLHGHGSDGAQIVSRPDIAENWVPGLLKHNASILAPNLRGNAWMSGAATEDLYRLLREKKEHCRWKKIFIVSGSMGGTGGLIFSMLHPELVDGVAALGAATDLVTYHNWCAIQEKPILREIHDAISSAYPTRQHLERHSVRRHAPRLTMPVLLYHGNADEIIPVSEARALAKCLSAKQDFHYHEIEDGGHDSPLPFFSKALETLIHSGGEQS